MQPCLNNETIFFSPAFVEIDEVIVDIWMLAHFLGFEIIAIYES